jgi:hypothetical protein
MKQIIKPKLESINYNLQLNMPNDRKSNWNLLRKLDQSFIGTSEYMGFAWFWDHEIKYYLRDATTKQKKYIHDSFLLNGVPLKPDEITKCNYFKTNDVALKIVEDYFNKT